MHNLFRQTLSPVPATLAAAALTLLLVPAAGASGSPDVAGRNFDARTSLAKSVHVRPGATQHAALVRLQETVTDVAVDFDAHTGAARSLRSHTGLLTAARPGIDAETVARDYLEARRSLLGLTQKDLADMRLTDRVESSVSGATHLHYRQTFDGLDAYGTELRISINRDGRVISVGNSFQPDLAGVAGRRAAVAVSATDAVARAAEFLGIALDRPPVAAPTKAMDRVLVSQGRLSQRDIDARLEWLPVPGSSARLVWRFVLDRTDISQAEEMTVDAVTGRIWTRFDRVSDAQYRAYAFPVESPHFTTPLPPSDARGLAVDPHDVATSPLGWHDDGSQSYTTLRGNNAFVSSDNVDCGASLDCDFSVDLSANPTLFPEAAATNVFYWANLFHDIQYVYGFDEAGGNFQQNNFGNGGVGGDPVDIRVHVSQTCNGTFSDSLDGTSGILNMYYCNGRDGAFDNGVTLHELGHGINRRQIGGPSTTCLNNTQSPDEGWSDWFGLVFTAETGDAGTDVRGLGSWLIGGGTTDTIRAQNYSTDPAVNTYTFQSMRTKSAPHGTGEVWAQGLWEMYWALVAQHGFNQDLSNLAAGAGNHRALFYVVEGQRLTPCNPTFLEARDAIIQAATDNHGGADVCTLWQAFADFGMGVDADGGSPSSLQVTNGFQVPVACGGSGNVAPSVTILAPANGASFTQGDTVSFSGSANDTEDGNLTPAMAWTSSLDGSIGSGGSFSTAGLSVGTHTITASATDSGNQTGSDSVQITVSGLCAPLGASCASNADCCSNRCRGKGSNKTCK